MGEMTRSEILKGGSTPAASVGRKKNAVPTHPEYDWHAAEWDFFLRSYEGGRNYTSNTSYLFSHQREAAEDRAFRLKRAVYYNYAGSVVDLFVSHLFRKEVTRETSSALCRRFIDNCDGRGGSLGTFMRTKVAPLALALGTVYVVVDRPRAGEGGYASLADEIAAGATPYCTLVLPQDVVNWEADASGELRWAVVREGARVTRGPFDGNRKRTNRFRIWTREKWFLVDEDGRPLPPSGEKGVEHGLGRVPIVKVLAEESVLHPGLGVSLIQDVAPLCRKVYNLASLLDEFLYKQCFSFLAWPGELSAESIGANNVAQFDPETSSQPLYVTPPTDPAAFLESQIRLNVEEIYRLARLEYSADRTAASGVSKAMDFHDASNVLARKAAVFERAEEEIVSLFFGWMKGSPDFKSTYPREFAVRALDREIEEALKLVDMKISKTFERNLKKRLARRALPNLPAGEASIIDREIDEARADGSSAGAGNKNA